MKVSDTILDDWTENPEDEGLSFAWTQVCGKHLQNFPKTMWCLNSGSGICGVEGCHNEADHYIDFDEDDIED